MRISATIGRTVLVQVGTEISFSQDLFEPSHNSSPSTRLHLQRQTIRREAFIQEKNREETIKPA
jgi:hypothetical protein